jgi:hypothetical protein
MGISTALKKKLINFLLTLDYFYFIDNKKKKKNLDLPKAPSLLPHLEARVLQALCPDKWPNVTLFH